MTIEEKAKAYDTALERAKGFYKETWNSYILKIFPELQESKDERIRKELIEFVKSRGGFKQEYIAWLEKQGEKPQGKSALEAIHEEKVDNANKVEPKFKVGDWVVYNHNPNLSPRKIIQITNEHYIFNNGSFEVKTLEADWHLWTIQDAKDGDVLCWNDSKCIVLFKNIYDKESFISYGFVGHCTGIFETRLTYPYHGIEGVHPATKEQRDLLFQKMREAGYEWDAEKKELRNIEK